MDLLTRTMTTTSTGDSGVRSVNPAAEEGLVPLPSPPLSASDDDSGVSLLGGGDEARGGRANRRPADPRSGGGLLAGMDLKQVSLCLWSLARIRWEGGG